MSPPPTTEEYFKYFLTQVGHSQKTDLDIKYTLNEDIGTVDK